MRILLDENKVKITVDKDPYEEGQFIFNKESIILKPGITVLVGCNGYGKSTFLNICQKLLRAADIKYIEFDNLRSGGNTAVGDALLTGDLNLAADMITGSEGEGIFSIFCRKAGCIGDYVRETDQKNLFVFIDGIDGLSINAILDLKKDLFDFAIKDAESKGKILYFIIATNDYEMASCGNCLDARNMQYVSFNSYEDYRKFILKTVDLKRKRDGVLKDE